MTAQLAYAVEKINRVPDRYRVYSESPDVALTMYRIDADLLAQSLDLGLPSRGAGADLRLDPLDLRNLAISLHLRVPWFVVMRWWSSALAQARVNTSRVYRVGISSRCGECASSGDCSFNTAPELLDAADTVEFAADSDVDLSAIVRLDGTATELPPDIAEVLRLADPIEWHVLPHALATDVAFLKGTGLADCRTMAHYLCDEASRRGLPARTAFGLLMTVPFSSEHQWVEFNTDGRWLPADPLLLNSLARWRYLDPAAWPSTTSLSGAVWRISEGYLPLALHGRLAVDSTLPTVIVSTTPLMG
jgi:hypothetical protein